MTPGPPSVAETRGWNDQDQLREVVTPDGSRWQYLYDGLGRRIAKQLMGDDGAWTERVDFTWDGTELAGQASATEDRVVSWDWSPYTGDPLAQTERPYGPELSQQEVDTRFYAIVTDLVGAPTEPVSPDGAIGWRLRTTLWGLPVDGSGGSTDCPLRFPGQYHDPETGQDSARWSSSSPWTRTKRPRRPVSTSVISMSGAVTGP